MTTKIYRLALALFALSTVTGSALAQKSFVGFNITNLPKVFITEFNNANTTAEKVMVGQSLRVMFLTEITREAVQVVDKKEHADFLLMGTVSVLPWFTTEEGAKIIVDYRLMDKAVGMMMLAEGFEVDATGNDIRAKVRIASRTIVKKILVNFQGELDLGEHEKDVKLDIRPTKILRSRGVVQSSQPKDYRRLEKKEGIKLIQGEYIIRARKSGFESFEQRIKIVTGRKTVFRIPANALQKLAANFQIKSMLPGSRVILKGRSLHQVSTYTLSQGMYDSLVPRSARRRRYFLGAPAIQALKRLQERQSKPDFTGNLDRVFKLEKLYRENVFNPQTRKLRLEDFDQFNSRLREEIVAKSADYPAYEFFIDSSGKVKTDQDQEVKGFYEKEAKIFIVSNLQVGQYGLKVLNFNKIENRITIHGPQILDQIEVVPPGEYAAESNVFDLKIAGVKSEGSGTLYFYINPERTGKIIFDWNAEYLFTLDNGYNEVVINNLKARNYRYFIKPMDSIRPRILWVAKSGTVKFPEKGDKVIFIDRFNRLSGFGAAAVRTRTQSPSVRRQTANRRELTVASRRKSKATDGAGAATPATTTVPAETAAPGEEAKPGAGAVLLSLLLLLLIL